MTDIRPSTPQLLDLAEAMRPDWNIDDLSGALVSAASNGWPFAKACLAAVRLLADPDATPRDLLAETRHPLENPVKREPPGDAGRGAALARSGMARALIEADMTKGGAA